jgi:hypothetical protein
MSDTPALDELFELWESCGEISMTPVNLRAMEKAAAELAELVKANKQLKDESLAFHVIAQLHTDNAKLQKDNINLTEQIIRLKDALWIADGSKLFRPH